MGRYSETSPDRGTKSLREMYNITSEKHGLRPLEKKLLKKKLKI